MTYLTARMDKVTIVSATQEEKKWAASLMAGTDPWISLGITANQIQSTVHDPQYGVYIAHLGHLPCGVIIIHPHGLAGSPYVKSVAVSKEFRNRGVGKAMLNFMGELFKDKSRFIFLCVSSFNTGARKFYEELGFTEVGELKDYIIEGESEILMSKRLL